MQRANTGMRSFTLQATTVVAMALALEAATER
jgi:hypothetical protein